MDLRSFIENQQRRLIDDYINTLRNKVHDLSRIIWKDDGVDAWYDQHPGNVKPFAYSRIYGPITSTTNSLTQYLLPTFPNPSVLIGREGSFYLEEVNYFGFSNWTFSLPGGAAPSNNGFLLDSAFMSNGGGVCDSECAVVRSTNDNYSPIGFDLVLYDKKRGRALHDNKLPIEMIRGVRTTNKTLAEPIRFDPNSNIEPRMFVTYPTAAADFTKTLANAGGDIIATRQIWVNILFKGHLAIEE